MGGDAVKGFPPQRPPPRSWPLRPVCLPGPGMGWPHGPLTPARAPGRWGARCPGAAFPAVSRPASPPPSPGRDGSIAEVLPPRTWHLPRLRLPPPARPRRHGRWPPPASHVRHPQPWTGLISPQAGGLGVLRLALPVPAAPQMVAPLSSQPRRFLPGPGGVQPAPHIPQLAAPNQTVLGHSREPADPSPGPLQPPPLTRPAVPPPHCSGACPQPPSSPFSASCGSARLPPAWGQRQPHGGERLDGEGLEGD